MNIYFALLLGISQRLNCEIVRRAYFVRYNNYLQALNKLGNSPKANMFRLAISCSEFSVEYSENSLWAEAAKLMRDIVDSGSLDHQLSSLHDLLVRNATYETTYFALPSAGPLPRVTYDDEDASTWPTTARATVH